ncbi:MAG: tetratricopeptide repeat protein [Firmicutes bacterium]|nr:tetratricopeptide repeat protein [Bacillota bacterium]
MFCPHCGFVITEADLKCGGCGRDLGVKRGPSFKKDAQAAAAGETKDTTAEKPESKDDEEAVELQIIKPWAIPGALKKKEEEELSSNFAIKTVDVKKKVGMSSAGFWKENLKFILLLVGIVAIAFAFLNPFFSKIKLEHEKEESEYKKMLTTGCESNNPRLHLRRAVFYRSQKKIDEAILDFDRAISLNRNFPDPHYEKGLLFLEDKKDYETAVFEFNEAIKLAPETKEYYMDRARANIKLKEYPKALDDYNDYIRIAPKIPDGYMEKGKLLEKLNKYEEAIAEYRKAVAAAPGNTKPQDMLSYALYIYGDILRGRGQIDEAAKCYQESFEQNPHQDHAKEELAKILFDKAQTALKQNNRTAAMEYLNKTLDVKNDFVDALAKRGEIYEMTNQKDKAVADFQKAFDMAPKRIQLKDNLIRLYKAAADDAERLKKTDDALAAYASLSRLVPNNVEYKFKRGMLMYNNQDYAGAVAELSSVVGKNPGNAKAAAALTDAYQKLAKQRFTEKNYKDAVNLLEGALKANPNNVELKVLTARARSLAGDPSRALSELDAILASAPNNADALAERANVRIIAKELPKALADADAAVKAGPGNARCHLVRGNVYEAMGDKAKATEDWKKARELAKPDSDDLAEAKQKLGEQ